MSKVEDFLSAKEEEEIIKAIQLAEKDTSGEIRVHIEIGTEKDPIERAKEVFYFLKMDQTELHNGVLFYLAVQDKKFSIIGDSGIDKVVPKDFWISIKDIVIENFKKGKYSEGLKLGIMQTGNKLKQYFPYQSNDKNELEDSISLN